MIAVFTRFAIDYQELDLTPPEMYVRVRDLSDIDGRKFTGVMKMYDWYVGDPRMIEAHDTLKSRQPELFKK